MNNIKQIAVAAAERVAGTQLPGVIEAFEAASSLAVCSFTQAILHGDDVHRARLQEACDAFINGKPMPTRPCPCLMPTKTDEAEEALRQICINHLDFDPSDGEGTMPSEVVEMLQTKLARNVKKAPVDWTELRDILHLPSTDDDRALILHTLRQRPLPLASLPLPMVVKTSNGWWWLWNDEQWCPAYLEYWATTAWRPAKMRITWLRATGGMSTGTLTASEISGERWGGRIQLPL